MDKSIHIAALDLGTSKISAMVAKKGWDGVLSIVAHEEIISENSIRRGCVFNVEAVSAKVTSLIRSLNRKLDNPIGKIYVGIGGQSLRTEPYTVKREVENEMVTKDLIDSMLEEAKDYRHQSDETLAAVSPEYYLDGRLEANPKGATCREIETRFQLILGQSALKKSLLSAIEFRGRVDIAGFFISPIATANAVLTDKEKELGCALIEFGAGITTVSIYKSGLLKYLVTIPLGGEVITKDIMSLSILEKEAEELKIRQGSALMDPNEENDINSAIEARSDEILANVFNQIEESGFANSLGAGIIITGGAALLREIPEVIQRKTGHTVRLASARRGIVNQAAELTQNPANSTIIGLLSLGTENCLKEKVIPEHRPDEKQVVQNDPPSLFGDDEVKKVERTKRIKPEPEKKEKSRFFDKFTKRVDIISRSLFDDDPKVDEEEKGKENDNKDNNQNKE